VEIDKAIQDYTACVNLNRNYGDALSNRAHLYAARKEWSKALRGTLST
jgi:hypothetical protein